jgi:arylsulfatase A-like enzyme
MPRVFGHGSGRMRFVFTLALVALALVGCGRRKEPAAPIVPRPVVKLGQAAAAKSFAAARPANIVIVVLDAARADHFGCYGYPRATTPNVDQLARESVLFREHYSTCSATRQSTASLFTSLYPDTHRLGANDTLPAGAFTLEQGLKAAGLETALLTSNYVVTPELGLGGDFDEIFPPLETRKTEGSLPEDQITTRTPEVLAGAFTRWLEEEKPAHFFAYLHFLPPHTPYDAPEAFTNAVAGRPAPPVVRAGYAFPDVVSPGNGFQAVPSGNWVDRYDANLRWADWGVGEMVRSLRAQELLDKTLLIVTADHGEAFGEHGFTYHARSVNEEFVHIPLLMRFPGPQHLVGEVTALTQTVDLLPTLCDLARAAYPKEKVQGYSLLPLLQGRAAKAREEAFAVCAVADLDCYLVRSPRWALLLFHDGVHRALYDMTKDPAQTQNVLAKHPEVVQQLLASFRTFARTQAVPLDRYLSPQAAAIPSPEARLVPKHPLSPRARRELRALGYLK